MQSQVLVLVIGNDPNLSSLIEMMLLDVPNVRTAVLACHGDVLPSVRELKPSLVLLDLGESQTAALEAVVQIKSDSGTKAIPVIALTTWSKARKAALQMGCDDCIEMPFDIDSFLVKVKSHLAE